MHHHRVYRGGGNVVWDCTTSGAAYAYPGLSSAWANVGSWVLYEMLGRVGTTVEECVGVEIIHNQWGGLDRCAKRAPVVPVIAEAGCMGRRYVSLQGDICCVVARGCTTYYKCRVGKS